jgi:hypothetical protein
MAARLLLLLQAVQQAYSLEQQQPYSSQDGLTVSRFSGQQFQAGVSADQQIRIFL